MRTSRSALLACGAALLGLAHPLLAQSITTVAGGGTDDGRPATAAAFAPIAAAVNGSGDIYVVDELANRVRKVAAGTGIVTTVAGNGAQGFSGDGGPATGAGLGPTGIALDASGNLYVSDGANHRIRRVAAGTGVITTVVGIGSAGFSGDSGPATSSELNTPGGIALAPSGGVLYIADRGNNRIRAVDLGTGVIRTIAGSTLNGFGGDGGPATLAALSSPAAVAVDGAGILYVADTANNRVRSVTLGSGVIATAAGNGAAAFAGDGGPATQASVNGPLGVGLDANGDLTIADSGNNRVRRVSGGTITTIAGTGTAAFAGDGGPATAAALNQPSAIVFGSSGTAYVVDWRNFRVREIGAGGTIGTVAGNGSSVFTGDGGPATQGGLAAPNAVAVAPSGDVYIADRDANRVRKVEKATGLVTTFAGTGVAGYGGDGGPATAAQLNHPASVALDKFGNLFVADTQNSRIREIEAGTGNITTVGGNGRTSYAADGSPATQTPFARPVAVATDDSGALYVIDADIARIRTFRVNGIVKTVVGTGTNDFSGDGGQATLAAVSNPAGLVLDGQRNIYIADTGNQRIRKVTSLSGVITTVAGSRAKGFGGDNGPASSAIFNNPSAIAIDAAGNLFVADRENERVRLIRGTTSVITTISGTGDATFSGDGGPATAGTLNTPSGLAVDSAGTVYVADLSNGRVRAISACQIVTTPALSAPADGATGVGTVATLSWSPVPGAFRYDLYFSRGIAPTTIVATDLVGTSFSVSNLQGGTVYAWKVVAKGDPFCLPLSSASSAVRTFMTVAGCANPGAFALTSPAEGVPSPSTTSFAWQAAPGAGTYDLFLGPTNPPGQAATGLTSPTTSVSGLSPNTTYYWYVVAHASCDPTRTTVSTQGTFLVQGVCTDVGAFAQTSPAAGATGVSTSPTLTWQPSTAAASYDLYLGAGTGEPPLYLSNLTVTSADVTGLTPGTAYRWRVVSRAGCDASKTFSTPTSTFTTGSCAAPAAPAFAFVPSGNVGAGQTYVVSWSPADGLDATGSYVVERSLTNGFATILDSQITTSTSASFVSNAAGTVYHRVHAIPGCDPSKAGPSSDVRAVTISNANPNVVFTVQPKAVITALGDRLEDARTTFTLENTSKSPVSVKLAQLFLGGSPPFFTIVDPNGGDVNNLALQPGQPRTLEVRFSGPSSTEESSYQGIIVVLQANFQPLPIAPFGYVNLKVGGSAAATPEFRVNGAPAEYAFFPGFSGDDAARPTISVDVANPGDTPMEIGAEIGPEVWLVTEPGWNATPIPPHASRTVHLSTARSLAPNGSALPRYTYFTVRTKSGGTARLLVQDNDATAVTSGRGALPERGVRTYIVPSVVHATSRIGNTFISKLRLSNVGSEAVQADLYFTPANADGFDAAQVKKATVVVPPNDVVTLTDPLIQLFGLTPNVAGQLEVRAAPEKIGLLSVTSGVDAAAATGGTFGFQLPTAFRGEGARLGLGHFLTGIVQSADFRTNLILAETTGLDHASVRAVLYDKDGNRKGDTLIDVPRYGQKQISGVGPALGGDTIDAGRIELTVESGGGSVASVITVIDNTNDDAVTYASRPMTGTQPPGLKRLLAARGIDPKAVTTQMLVVPAVVNGFPTFRSRPDLPYTFRSLLGFASQTLSPATYDLEYHDLQTGQVIKKSVTVKPRQTLEYQNVLEELFGIAPGARSQGPIFVTTGFNGNLYCKVYSNLPKGTLGDGFAVIPQSSDSVTGAGLSKPIYLDGLEQSTDEDRGTRSNLILNEIAGAPATVTVRLYEAGNRAVPIAEQTITLAPLEKKQLSTLFSGLDLDSDTRRKDRANVLVQVTSTQGNGLVSAIVTTIDNKTGDTRNAQLSPTGGSSATGSSIGF